MNREYNEQAANAVESVVERVAREVGINRERVDGLLYQLGKAGPKGIHRADFREMITDVELRDNFYQIVAGLYKEGIIIGPREHQIFLENAGYHYLKSLWPGEEWLSETSPTCIAISRCGSPVSPETLERMKKLRKVEIKRDKRAGPIIIDYLSSGIRKLVDIYARLRRKNIESEDGTKPILRSEASKCGRQGLDAEVLEKYLKSKGGGENEN